MASGIPREVHASIDARILRQMKPRRWSISDSMQYYSIKKAIKTAKKKGKHCIGWFHLRILVRAKLIESGCMVYFNCGYWVIRWS